MQFLVSIFALLLYYYDLNVEFFPITFTKTTKKYLHGTVQLCQLLPYELYITSTKSYSCDMYQKYKTLFAVLYSMVFTVTLQVIFRNPVVHAQNPMVVIWYHVQNIMVLPWYVLH